jgi:hypothetical protein
MSPLTGTWPRLSSSSLGPSSTDAARTVHPNDDEAILSLLRLYKHPKLHNKINK